MNNQPLAKLDYQGKYKDISLDKFAKIQIIKNTPPETIVDLMDLYEAANKQLQGNWDEIKTQLSFTIENYGDVCNIEIVEQILREMEKLEK